jgi:5-methylcytosine-specific restriction protein A
MPQKMLRPCYKQGCPNLTREKYCEQHAYLGERERADSQKRYNRFSRDKDAQKFYQSAAWQNIRALKISRTPYCEQCYAEGRMIFAEIVDHKVEIADGGAKLDIANLTSLCRACHNRKTAAERGKRYNNNN